MTMPDDSNDEGDDPDLVEWAAEMADRIQAGEAVDLEELERTRPELAAMLRRLLSAIKMMSSLRERPASEAGEGVDAKKDVDDSLKRLGDFELVREIGRGGMGVVYEARQCKLGYRRVALKILPAAAALDPRLVRRFQVEVEAAACLDHPHIVPVYDVDQEQGVPYFAMRFIEGRSIEKIILELRRLRRLRDRAAPADEEKAPPSKPDELATTIANMLTSGSLADPGETQVEGRAPEGEKGRPVMDAGPTPGPDPTLSAPQGSSTGDRAYFRTVARLGIEAAEALDYAHREGVIHRDVKPANLLVDLQGRLWVVDFGVARLRGGRDLTGPGELVGTLRYMSPEQAKGGRIPIDRLTDVYSLGATLYEMLTLRPAFSSRDTARLLRRIAEEEPRPPRRLNRRISRDLENIVLKAMAKDRAQRYQSAGELADDLGRFLKGLPVRARRVPIWRRAVAWVKTHRTTAALVSTGVAAVLLFVWVHGVLQSKEEEYLARRFESAGVEQAAELIPLLRVSSPPVADWLDRLFKTGDSDRKLAAALALAPNRDDCQDHIVDRLLDADPKRLGFLAPIAARQFPAPLVDRLQGRIRGKPPAKLTPGEAEARDRRRANAACALILLGRDDSAWQFLRSSPDPQTRSFLISALGPAGVPPEVLVAHLDDPSTSSDARAAAIQSLGGVADASWAKDRRASFETALLGIYRNDPDAGVHGAAKWLLLRWGLGGVIRRTNAELARQPSDPRFRWRISRSGLTLVTVDDPALNRVIEVSDSEITIELFLRFRRGFEFLKIYGVKPDCPINAPSFYEAAEFCNWLNEQEEIPRDQDCYRCQGADELRALLIPGHLERAGFRLPTSREFGVFCSAGAPTRRYYGDTDRLLDRYAWTPNDQDGAARPVAGKLPNDLGLFDTLGNLQEWCEADDPIDPDGSFKADLRGGWFNHAPASDLDRNSGFPRIDAKKVGNNPMNTLRVVRTKSVR